MNFQHGTASAPTLGPHPAYPVGTGAPYRGGKAAGTWSWPPASI